MMPFRLSVAAKLAAVVVIVVGLSACGATEEAAPASEEATVEEITSESGAVREEVVVEDITSDPDDPALDLDVSADGQHVLSPGQCDHSDTAEFPWPPPAPTDAIKLDTLWFGITANGELTVSEVAFSVERALRSVGHVQVGYQAVGCDGFAAISSLERIDELGRPLPGDVRFLPPGASEPWSLTRFLTQLMKAPEGKYRQIVIVGTDKDWEEFDRAPTPSEVLQMADDADPSVPAALSEYKWRARHRLTALVYEFDRPAGNGDPIWVPPRGLGAVTHLSGSGLYKPGD